ncbi:nuclear transport factor 2 family protein [uncultured Tateyamaria sp.]|uniref:nuclear transport factor 2 family protein n=1 Tax=uncultured Tateyamaria sp. TaxID=455651 RepID=UPI00261CE5FF|nr:nuclear transport factor 2 family protein [uncultured Tateyamaria sp.]
MVDIVKSNASVVENGSYGEIAAIERVLKSSFGRSAPTNTRPASHEVLNFGNAEIVAMPTPCPDQNHQVSLIDVAGPSAAAIVEFTDCSGASFSDLYVLQKRNDQWAISEKVWDSHAHS